MRFWNVLLEWRKTKENIFLLPKAENEKKIGLFVNTKVPLIVI